MNKYMISLHGGGDDYYIIVGEATFKWLDSPRPASLSRGTSAREAVPAEVLAEATKKVPIESFCEVTSGSCENDRALHLLELFKYTTSHPKKLEVEDVWEGCIY